VTAPWRIVCDLGVLLAHSSKDVHRLVSGSKLQRLPARTRTGCRSRRCDPAFAEAVLNQPRLVDTGCVSGAPLGVTAYGVLSRGLLGGTWLSKQAAAPGDMLEFSEDDLAAIERAVPPDAVAGERYDERQMAMLDSEAGARPKVRMPRASEAPALRHCVGARRPGRQCRSLPSCSAHASHTASQSVRRPAIIGVHPRTSLTGNHRIVMRAGDH
jgi:hypothetical protein